VYLRVGAIGAAVPGNIDSKEQQTGRKNKYFKWKIWFSALNKFELSSIWDNSINNLYFFFKFVISVRGGHCDYRSQAPKSLATPLAIWQDSIHKVPVILHDNNLQHESHKPYGPPTLVTWLHVLRKPTKSTISSAPIAETHWSTYTRIHAVFRTETSV